ncbi:hypothetical protein F3Y22_tig00110384pilonHSYRG00841 [Hibiscus syriacus]|uniref:Reverse transcriptase domain-containing protein n=1 Tax=Hibiscus syriacus TaxID=106335 RepID=A0A6A3AU63_HIBSY|nr:hypothetical protein F3Y22_tig00110384pilonHSYRG00841 [Hibiscus syriacus]
MENPCENSAPPLREYCNPSPPIFVPPAPPSIGGNLAGNQHGIEVLLSPPLERLGSPFPDEDQRVTKKVCNKEMNVDRMEEDQRGMETQSVVNSIGQGTRQQEKRSYASAVTSQLKQTMDVVSLQAMDEVVVLDGECIVDINGQYLVIQFADQVHDRIYYIIRRSVLVRLLGRAIGFKTAMDDFWILSNGSTMESYIHHIRKTSIAGCEESGFGPWMIAEMRRRRTKKNPGPNMKTSGDDTRGSRFAILGEGNDGIDEDFTVIPEVAVDVTNMEEGLANTSRIDSRVKGKGTRPTEKTKEIRTLQQVDKERPSNGSMESGASRLGYPGRSEKTEAIQTLQQINVIAMKDGVIPQVAEYRNVRAVGNQSVVTILEDSRLHVASKNIQNKGNKCEVGDSSKGLKDAGSPSFRRYLREHCREHRPGIIALLKTQINGNVVEKAIRTFGFQNSFRFEALGFSGGTMVLHLDRVGSDHCPLLLKAQNTTRVQGNRPFRFIAAWQDHPQFKSFLSEEVVHSMRLKKGKIDYMAIKIDLEKSYDSLEWPFIDDTLKELRIPDKLRMLIMRCISSVSTQVLWNGAMSASFNPSRGLRQGDPLSVYLFVMCMERLGHAITGVVNNGRWKPIRLCRNGPALSHLFFADDLVLLDEASIEQCDVIRGILELFCKSSGQKINMQKTTIYYSKNVDLDLKNSISASFGFQEVQNLGKYLGVPLLHSRITKASYSYIVSRVRDKLTRWKEKSLSLAGRITLAKIVLSVIPSYSMQSTMLPKGICEEIERLIQGFIWGRTENRGGVPLVHWENICKPTVNGGLGLRKLSVQNEALLMKLAYKLVVNSDQLWARVLRSKYKWVKLIPESINHMRSSHVWKGKIGFVIWDLVVNIAERNNLLRQSVSSIVDHNGQWHWEFIIDKLPNTIVQRLAATMPPRQSCRMDALERVRQHMATTSNCGICGQTGESSDHLFCQCYMAMAIWSTLVKTEKLEDFCTRDIRSWMQINIASPGFYAHEENDWDLRRLTLEANRAMESSLSTIQLSHRSCTMPDVWQPPPHNWFEAELWGIHEGLSHSWNLGERLITMEIDSLEVIRMLKKNTKRGSILTLIDCVNELINRNLNVDLKHISRNANKVADRLAKIAVTRGEVHIVFSTPPWEVIDIVQREAEDYTLSVEA